MLCFCMLLSSIMSHLFIFIILGSGLKRSCCDLCQSVLPMFSSKSCIVSGLTIRSLIHSEFIFVYGVRKCSNFILLRVAVQFSHHHLLKRLSLPHGIFLPPLSRIRCPQVCGLISRLLSSFHWSIFLFVCQSGRLIPPAPFFFLKIALTIWGLLYFVFPYKL